MPDTLEERSVLVDIPKLSADANHRLTEAVRSVVGSDRVRVPADRPRVSQGENAHLRPSQRVTATKAMSVGVLAVAACVGLIIVIWAGNSWWLTALAFVVLAVALAIVIMTIMGLASTTEFSDPFLSALLSEQGVHDPDVLFTTLVDEFTPEPEGGHRTAAVEDDPAKAAAEQREAITPSGGPSEAVGP